MLVVIKKAYLIFSGAILTCLFLGIFIATIASDEKDEQTLATVINKDAQTPVIVIDAGHGEPDGGCVGKDNTKESELNLSVSKKLEQLLTENYTTIMTRTTESGIHSEKSKSIAEKKRSDMNKRKEIKTSSNADIFVSIHMNKFEQEKYYGAQVIYDKTNEKAKLLAEKIQEKLCEIDETNHRKAMPCTSSVFLLKSSPIPSVIVECGFLSNSTELKKLKTDEYQLQIASAIKRGIDDYFSDSSESIPKTQKKE